MLGGVRTERGRDQPRVVGADRIVDQAQAPVVEPQERQRAQHPAPLGGVAVAVELGELALGAARPPRPAAACAPRRRSSTRGRRPDRRPPPAARARPCDRPSGTATAARSASAATAALVSRSHSRPFGRRARLERGGQILHRDPPPPVARPAARPWPRAPSRGPHANGARARRRPARRTRSSYRTLRLSSRSSSPSPNIRCSCTPRRMSSIWTCASVVGAAPHALGDRHRLQADDVADVERQPERRRVPEPPLQLLVVGQRLDQHPRLRLERECDARRSACASTRSQPSTQQVPGALGRLALGRDARPHRDHRSAELDRDVDRRAQQIDPPQAAVVKAASGSACAADRARTAPGLHHAVEPGLLELGAQPRGARAQPRRERIEVDVVERQRDAGVAVLGQQLERILDAGGRTARWRRSRTSRDRPLLRAARRASGHSDATPAAGTSAPGRPAGRPPAASARGSPRRPRAAAAPAWARGRRRRARGRPPPA